MLSATFCVYNKPEHKWNLIFLCDNKSSWSFYRVSSILYVRVGILHRSLKGRDTVNGNLWNTRHPHIWKPSRAPVSKGRELSLTTAPHAVFDYCLFLFIEVKDFLMVPQLLNIRVIEVKEEVHLFEKICPKIYLSRLSVKIRQMVCHRFVKTNSVLG